MDTGYWYAWKTRTGKTSTIKCIANHTNRHLVVIPLNLIKTCSQLTDCFFESTFVDDNEKKYYKL